LAVTNRQDLRERLVIDEQLAASSSIAGMPGLKADMWSCCTLSSIGNTDIKFLYRGPIALTLHTFTYRAI
jgi:hypothetical protein